MRRSIARIPLALALLALLAPLGACRTATIRVEIPGFGDGNVDGLWFWRYSDDLGSFERTCRIEFSNATPAEAGEQLEYVQVCDDPDALSLQLASPIVRAPEDPASIVVELYYTRWESDPGVFRATAYNAEGESPLSETEITL